MCPKLYKSNPAVTFKLFLIERICLITSFFLCLQTTNIFAQTKTIDSLKKVLTSLHDTARINCLNTLSKYYCNYNQAIPHYARTDSAELCVNEAYAEAENLNYKLGMGEAYLNLAEIKLRRWDFFGAQKYTEKAISGFKNLNNETELIQAYSILEDVFLSERDNTSAITYAEKLLDYYKKRKDTIGEADAWEALSASYSWQGKNDKAFECFKNEYELTKDLSDSASRLRTLKNEQGLYQMAGWSDSLVACTAEIIAYEKQMGIDTGGVNQKGFKFFVENKWDSAEYYDKKEYKIIEANNNIDSIIKKRQMRRNDIDLASVYQMEGRHKEALPMFMKALQYDKKNNIAFEELEVLLNISGMNMYDEKYDNAIQYAKTLLALAKKTQASYYILGAYEVLWRTYDKKKDAVNAYRYYQKYTALKDSTNTSSYQRQLSVINELNNERFQQQKITALDKDNKLKEAAIEKNLLMRNILLAGFASLILIGFFIYRFINLKHKNEKHLRELAENELQIQKLESQKKETELKHQASQLEMQALRAQMNPHFIFNCLNSINRFIIKNDAAKAADYLTKFAKLIRIVLQQSGKPFIPLEDELKCLQLYMDLEALRFEKPFYYTIDYHDIDIASVMIPTLLIQPFIENAIWHGLQGKNDGNGKISIDMHIQNNILQCAVCDNGIGRLASVIKEEKDVTKSSLGINLTQRRLQLIDPSKQNEAGIQFQDIKIDSQLNKGTCVYIKIPVNIV